MKPDRQLSLAVFAALGLTGFVAVPSIAQVEPSLNDAEMILEEVIVTGTRIISENGHGQTSPVTVISMDEVNAFGYTRVEEFLNTLPQIDVHNSSFDSNGASGTASLNLRGLGAKRNLVLINGRRMQPGGVFAYEPDVNQIPAQMIERVEVLTGGASATYGTDAVAGVVNFITRRVNGFEINAGISAYQHDNQNTYIQGLMDEKGFEYPTGSTGFDGKAHNVSIVIGRDFASDRGNATAYVIWRKNDALLQGSRDYSNCALNGKGTACGGSYFAAPVPNFFIAPITEDGWGPYGYDYSQEQLLILQPDSSLAVDPRWGPPWWGSSNLYNYAPVNYYMRPDERWSLGAFVDYEINQHAVAYLETMGFNDRSNAQIAESGTFMDEVYPLKLSNAYFPESFRQSLEELWPGVNDFGIFIGKRNNEGGPRIDQFEHASFRIVTGLRGSITDDWNYDVSYLYAQTDSSSTYLNDFLAPKIATAVDSRLCEPDPDCIPYEVFTYQGVSKEAADSLSGIGKGKANTTTSVLQTYVTGTAPWGLSAGNIMAVAGFEYRRVEVERISNEIYEQGLLLGHDLAVKNITGGYSVNELFLETNIPLLADLAFARNMTLDLAYRRSDYSASGQNNTYRVGLDWQVLDWLRARTGFNHAVRTPNIAELYSPQQIGVFNGADLCEGAVPVYSFEECTRTGVTAQQYGHIGAVPYEDWGHNALYGGNPELDPEAADTFTVGLVFDIGDSMQLSVDYWDIRVEDVIECMEPAIALEQCALYDRLCDLVHRAPGSGSLWRSDDGYVVGIDWNLGDAHYRGVDTVWTWSPGDHWQLDLVGSYYLKRQQTAIPKNPETTWDCAGLARSDWGGETQACDPTPKWRHTASVTYDSNSFWSVTGRWRYFSKVTYDGDLDEIAADNLGAQGYFDLSTVLRFMNTHDLTLGVNNALDEEPPMVGGSLSDNANSINNYDLLGRFLFANLTLRW
ncbi:MAG: TonB-dependent receptor [Xanthomonadales bacterium]|nr:TonB-dependent receptor [Xanthomonadales bacterium]